MANYDAQIRIGVEGAQQVRQLRYEIKQLDREIQSRRSLQAFPPAAREARFNTLATREGLASKAQRTLRGAEIGSAQERQALSIYLRAQGQLNQALADRARLINLAAKEEDAVNRTRRAAELRALRAAQRNPVTANEFGARVSNLRSQLGGTAFGGRNETLVAARYTSALADNARQLEARSALLRQLTAAENTRYRAQLGAGTVQRNPLVQAERNAMAAKIKAERQIERELKARAMAEKAAAKAASKTATGGMAARMPKGPKPLFSGTRKDAILSGIMGGAFPMLFGQGPGTSLGGLGGGVLGGAMGGMGGMALGIAGSALGQAIDTLVANMQGLAASLKSPTEALKALETSGFRVSDSLKFQVDQLMKVGRAYDAQTLVLQEVERRLGAGAVQELNALNEEQKKLQEQWSQLSGTAQRQVIPALTGAIQAVNAFVAALSAIPQPPDWLLTILARNTASNAITAALPQLAGGGPLAVQAFRLAQGSGRSAAANAPERQPLPDDQAFAAETARINRARELEDLQRSIQRGELDLLRRKEDIEFQIIDQRRAESDYEREVADFRWSIEQRVFQLRADAIRAEQELAQARSDVRVAEIGIDFDERIFNASNDRQAEVLEASKNFLQVREQTETSIEQNKIETALRIEQLKQEQINRERQLEREKEALERRKDELLRGRIRLERGIADYQMDVADYMRETARKVFDAWRQIASEQGSGAGTGGGVPGGSVGGRYIQGGIGPRGANQYGAHFDVKRTDGSYFDRKALDAYVRVNGMPLSSGTTVPGGQFGASRDGGTREHRAWDYAFGGGAALTLTGGAKWVGSSRGSYGDNTAFQTPDGKVYRLIHGRFEPGTPAATSGEQQGPNTKPWIKIGQGAMLNGEAVTWNGNTWVKAVVPGAPSAAMAPPPDLAAPARPAAPALSGIPDTTPLERAGQQSTTRQTAAVREAEQFLERLARTNEQAAFNALARTIEGENRLDDAKQQLRLEELLLQNGTARNELEDDRLALSAKQTLEYENAERLLRSSNALIDELVAKGLSPERATELRNRATQGFRNTVQAQGIERQAQATRDIREFNEAMSELETQARLTGAGLRVGLIGPMAEAFEEAQRRGYDPAQTEEFVERAKILQDQQLVWDNLAKDIVSVSDAIAGGLTNGLADIVTGARSIKDVGKEVLDSIASSFLDSAQQQLSAVLQRQIAGALGGEGGVLQSLFGQGLDATAASGPAALGSASTVAATQVAAFGVALQTVIGQMTLSTAFSGITSGIGGAVTSSFGSAFSSAAPNLLSSVFGGASPLTTSFIPAFANGGDPPVGKVSIVGENGPELFVPKSRGTIVPMSDVGKAENLKALDDGNQQYAEIDVRYEAKEIAGERYVTEDQFRQGMARAAKQGQAMAYSGMRNRKGVRSQVGI